MTGSDRSPAGGWGWKRASSIEDLLDFINGRPPYRRPVAEFRVAATARDDEADFFVFYRTGRTDGSRGGWGWKLATTAHDAWKFLNGVDPYGGPVGDAQIAAVNLDGSPRFYVMYRRAAPGETLGTWGWKRSAHEGDVMRFLNGEDPYNRPVTKARIAKFTTGAHDQFYVFYQGAAHGTTISNWAWKRSTDAADALDFVNGTAPYGAPVDGFDIGAVERGRWTDFNVFYNRGPSLWLESPLENERFVTGEPVQLAAVTTEVADPGAVVSWSSDRDGFLGRGSPLLVASLSPGVHVITAQASDLSASTTVRIYEHLGALYQAAPSAAEIERIRGELTLDLVDGSGTDESWAPYLDSGFDQTSTDPSELVAMAKLDVLRHQRFAEPLPFTGGSTIHAHVLDHIRSMGLTLECRLNSAGGDHVTLARNFSVWDARLGTAADDPEACKEPFANVELAPYIGSLKLLVHEGRHCEPDDPGHDWCDGRPKDTTLEGGSGYAQGALYDMWVYKYGLSDPPEIKEQARAAAVGALQSVFCTTPTHSDPRVQAIIDELIGP